MVRPLEYNSGLSLAQAEERFIEVRNEFKRIKSSYSGLFSRFKKDIRYHDKRSLSDCVGVLLPLYMEESVLGQVGKTEDFEETLHYKIGELNVQIQEYLTKFKNS